MVNFFIKIVFSLVTLYIFIYSCSFINFEMKSNNNFLGGIFTFIFVFGSVIFSNVVFWLDWY